MKDNNISKGEIVIYQTSKKEVELKVQLEKETVWLNLNQIADLFDTDKSGISRHVKNIYQSEELKRNSTVAKIATVQIEGDRGIKRDIEYYNLDVIISVGYRVNSQRATQSRIWATKVLKDYLVQGYALNQKRLLEQASKFRELQRVISFIKQKTTQPKLKSQAEEFLNIIANLLK